MPGSSVVGLLWAFGLWSGAVGMRGVPDGIPAGAADNQPSSLVVRNGTRVQSVPVVEHPDGGRALRADLLFEALGGRLVTESDSRVRAELGGFSLVLVPGQAMAIAPADTFPMVTGAFRREGRVYMPWSIATDLLPRIGGGVIFDAAKNELRRFTIVSTTRPEAVAPKASGQTSPPQGATRLATDDTNARTATRRRIVVVDAGHGGVDPGMSAAIGGGQRLKEKDVTLAVSRELRAALERRGVTVVMTRSRDTLIALSDRGRIANAAKGDLFMSIHVNAANPRWSKPGSVRGFETYFLAEAKTDDEKRVEAMENEAIRFETTVDASRHDPLGFIIRDMAQNEHLRESSRLASLIQGSMKSIHPGSDRGVKQAGFRVLVSAFMPAVLVEIGYGTNAGDAAWMTSPARQRELAESMADAAVAYLAEYERKVGGP